MENLLTIVEILLSQDQKWWMAGGGYGWFLLMLDEVRRTDNEETIRNSAAELLKPLSKSCPIQDVRWTWQGEWRGPKDIRTDAERHPIGSAVISDVDDLASRIEAWATGQKEGISMEKHSGALRPTELPP